MKSIDIRELAISHFKDGKKLSQIAEILKNQAHVSTICRWIANFKKYGHVLPHFIWTSENSKNKKAGRFGKKTSKVE